MALDTLWVKKMFRKAQWTFIGITMGIILVVFAIIFAGASMLFNISHDRYVENTLSNSFTTLVNHNEVSPEKIVVVDGEIKSVGTLTNENAQTLVDTIKSLDNGNFGRTGNFYYKYFSTKSGSIVIIASDMSETIATLRSNSVTALIYITIIYAFIFVLVWQLSYKVFEPIRNNFEKQKQFISDASHELKTPISIISANADVLKQNNSDSQWVDNIKSQTVRMNNLVGDMLSLAKLDEGRFELLHENFDVSEAVTECALPFDAVAFEKNKQLIINIPPNIHHVGDKSSIKKITSILIDNAIKHSSNENIITVTLKKDNGKIELSVYNTGSEIEPKEANKIFQRFYRGDSSRSRESGGSGLGLSIAKSIADANKWKLSAKSILNECITITLTIKSKS